MRTILALFVYLMITEGTSEYAVDVDYSYCSLRYLRDNLRSRLNDPQMGRTFILVPNWSIPQPVWSMRTERITGRFIIQPISPIERFCYGGEMIRAPFSSNDESVIMDVSVSLIPSDRNVARATIATRPPLHISYSLKLDPTYLYIGLSYDSGLAISNEIARVTGATVIHDYRTSLWNIPRWQCTDDVLDRAPILTFSIASSLEILLYPRDYIRPELDSSCTILIESSFTAQPNRGILGQPILRHVSMLFDYDDATVGFCNPL